VATVFFISWSNCTSGGAGGNTSHKNCCLINNRQGSSLGTCLPPSPLAMAKSSVKILWDCVTLFSLLSTREMHTHETMKEKTSASYAAYVYSEAWNSTNVVCHVLLERWPNFARTSSICHQNDCCIARTSTWYAELCPSRAFQPKQFSVQFVGALFRLRKLTNSSHMLWNLGFSPL
jgi:hypothetical protein